MWPVAWRGTVEHGAGVETKRGRRLRAHIRSLTGPVSRGAQLLPVVAAEVAATVAATVTAVAAAMESRTASAAH